VLGIPAIGLKEETFAPVDALLKRMLDVCVSLAVILLTWPVMLVIALAIRLDSPGSALFLQERVGQHNRRFTMYKFRTMYTDAEQRAAEVAVQTDAGIVHKHRGDPRVTRIGAQLRRMSMDELPQLFNVLRGDMSLIGPRPELTWIVDGSYQPWQYQRLLVPQGISGWWQVHGRATRVMHLHTEDDIHYVRHASFRLDLQILVMTLREVLTGRGAY